MSCHVVRCRVSGLRGSIRVPGDKSIAHRAVMLAGLAHGTTRIENFPRHNDSQATIAVLRQLGVRIDASSAASGLISVRGRGLFGLAASVRPLFCGESGTTLRLLAGILCGQRFDSCLSGAAGLLRRPMSRITVPLRMMGAQIRATRAAGRAATEEYAPLYISGRPLQPIRYTLPVASAQVKSCLLLAGLYAGGPSRIIEPLATRDHTERMLAMFGAGIRRRGQKICIDPARPLKALKRLYIPGDISSAAFFIVAGLIVPGSRILLSRVSLNPTRCGVLSVLRRMGGRLRIRNRRAGAGEPYGDILVESSQLRAVKVSAAEVPGLIDELPVLMVAAGCARGSSVFEGIQELRVKETDRIRSMTTNLKKLGVSTTVFRRNGLECLRVTGGNPLKGAAVSGWGDHRTSMSMAVAGLAAAGSTSISGIECIDKSFPGFFRLLGSLQ